MYQTKKGSAIETILNVGSGYFIASILNLLFLPFFIDEIQNYDIKIALLIGLVYTSVSMIRSFTFRRIFNNFMGKRKWL